MSAEIPKPEIQQPLRPLEQATRAADFILEHLGNPSPLLQSVRASVPLDETALTTIPENALPIVSIEKAIGPFRERVDWAYTIEYGMQDGAASRTITIPKDTSMRPRISSSDAGAIANPREATLTTVSIDRPISTKEEVELARDLSKIAG